jgi:hypothetical protein
MTLEVFIQADEKARVVYLMCVPGMKKMSVNERHTITRTAHAKKNDGHIAILCRLIPQDFE